MEPIVRAIDVGYRNCKWVERVESQRIICKSFPSIAPLATDRDLGVDRSARRNTVVVPVNSLRYEVGPDAALAQASVAVRNLDDMYVLTDEYLAIVRGALRLMRVDHVDLLVVGLPVSLFKQRRAELESRLTGEHQMGDDRTVRVGRVVVIAQPMGAFLGYTVPNKKRESMLQERNLIIDPGWRTFDWVVTDGVKPFTRRSDAVNKGMYDVIEAIAQAIGEKHNCRLTLFDYERIDAALRRKAPLKVNGKPIDLEPYLPAGQRVVQEAITAMRQLVQDGSDIDNFLIAGGGTFFYRPAIEKAYPGRKILQVDEPVFANVRGFQIAGMEIAAADKRRAQKATQAGQALHAE